MNIQVNVNHIIKEETIMEGRLGARRLDAALRRGVTGKDTSYQAGAGISDAVVSHRMYNEGVFVITKLF